MDQSAVGQQQDTIYSSGTPEVTGCGPIEEPQPSTLLDENISTPLESQAGKSSSETSEKANAIRRACNLRDLNTLVSHATSQGGLLQDELRQLACKFPSAIRWPAVIIMV